MFFKPLLIRSRMASRSCTLPSPRVILPLRSRTVTPSTSREAILSATGIPPCWYFGYSTFAGSSGGKIPVCPNRQQVVVAPLRRRRSPRKYSKFFRQLAQGVLPASTRFQDAVVESVPHP